jgi:hypothetical protein
MESSEVSFCRGTFYSTATGVCHRAHQATAALVYWTHESATRMNGIGPLPQQPKLKFNLGPLNQNLHFEPSKSIQKKWKKQKNLKINYFREEEKPLVSCSWRHHQYHQSDISLKLAFTEWIRAWQRVTTRQRAEPYGRRLGRSIGPLYLWKPLVDIYSQYMGCSRKQLSIIIWLSYDWFHKLKPIVPYKQLLKFIMFCHLDFGKISTLHLNPCWQHTSLASYLVENVLINLLDDIGHVILGDLKIFTWFNW